MPLSLASLLLAGVFFFVQGSTAWALPQAKSFVYIVPDGFGPASQTMARDYASLLRNGENPDAPVSIQLAADTMVSSFILRPLFHPTLCRDVVSCRVLIWESE